MSLKKQLTFTKKLSHLYKSGQPILTCLQFIVENESNSFLREIFQNIIDEIKHGKTFAVALKDYEDLFGSAYINLINIGEKTGRLDVVLARLNEYIESVIAIRNKVISASIYPIVLILVYVGLFTIILTGVIFMGMKFMPTAPIWAIINPVNICCVIPLFLALLILLVYICWSITNIGFIGDIKDRFVLVIPGVGSLIKLSNLFSYLFTMKICYESGVSVYETSELAISNLTNSYIYEKLEKASVNIKAGATISQALTQTNLFSYDVIQLLRVGEQAGTLDGAYQDAISMIEEQINKTLAIMIVLIKPLGILLGLFMLGSIFCGVFSFVIFYIKSALRCAG